MSHIILGNRNKLHLRRAGAGIYGAPEYAVGHEGETRCCQIGSTISGTPERTIPFGEEHQRRLLQKIRRGGSLKGT